ncbi:SNF2-related protein [Solimonas sp. SE-A11]|uniref:SNF2-related protein n=1 Tax=Solimonas sp. SE-A11 TaxID=3054954 RepID=UPI00259CA3A2|nr:SNF2-related protein [Solimonas sp. SE-A11]MDM4770882.1 SNF2-related protein [Solimonas sp. SE-A11]
MEDALDTAAVAAEDLVVPLQEFVADFGDGLLDAVSRQNPPIYDGSRNPARDAVMDALKRKPFEAQRDVVHAVTRLLVDAGDPAAVINAEMGTGKTMMAIAVAAVLQQAEAFGRVLVISPPHLVYKWRREILETVKDARVTVLNGPDTLRQLLKMRAAAAAGVGSTGKEFVILGRVRMRMGFHWRPAVVPRRMLVPQAEGQPPVPAADRLQLAASCPRCGEHVQDLDGNPVPVSVFTEDRRLACSACREPLWTLIRGEYQPRSRAELVAQALCQIPTIGQKTAQRLIGEFGEEQLGGMLEDNVYEFVNLMNAEGELVFSDRQARRMERAMATMEFSLGQGGYQATEFVKRYLPDGYFDVLVVDEGHEYKNEGSAQGQAMAVLARKVRKVVLLTGTLMGGYADDLFHLLWRIMPERMIEDGFRYQRGSLGPAAMSFMRRHGVLRDIYKESDGGAHKTSRGKRLTVRTVKAPGFGPKGIARYVLPYTVFLKLKDIGANVLPPYQEHFTEIRLDGDQAKAYQMLQATLTSAMREALRKGDNSLLGVVLNVLLAWPDCCFREEVVRHPRTRQELIRIPALFGAESMPKERALIDLCRREKAAGRRVLVYTTYTGTRDTSSRLKALLEQAGLRAAVLRASVETSKREDWIAEQVDRGVDVVVTNPELVKTGLDLLEFPTIAFMQSGYNVYTLQQAARRSWRIGQKEAVGVHFFGYAETTQIACLRLMAQKIAVSQSTSGDMPDTGLDVLNQDGDSIEVALAKQLLAA